MERILVVRTKQFLFSILERIFAYYEKPISLFNVMMSLERNSVGVKRRC